MIRQLVRGFGEFYFPTDNELDLAVCEEVLRGKTYPKIAGNAELIWDVGANIGAAALYFARTYPNAEIHCFEPSGGDVWECLQENTSRIRSRTALHNYGLAGRAEERPLQQWAYATVTRSCHNLCGSETVVDAPSGRFQEPPDPRGVTIMKIDTEGCEIEILEALGDNRERIPVYYLEYHSESDRRKMDEMLPEHDLVRSSSDRKHRGNVCYLHRSIATVEDKMEIR